jgi:hypothetical protein
MTATADFTSSLTTTPPIKTPKVHRWLPRRPRFRPHFTPTGSSRLNMVERFFARITTEASVGEGCWVFVMLGEVGINSGFKLAHRRKAFYLDCLRRCYLQENSKTPFLERTYLA